MASQPKARVLEIIRAGGNKFLDFIKVGLPLNGIFCAIAVFLVSRIWPF